MQTNTATIPSIVVDRLIRDRAALNALFVIAASGLIAIAAQIAINVPFSPVPLTLQPVAVLFVGAALGSRRGAAAAALYLFEGVIGMPVFAQAHGGAIWLAGPTGGYLLSYPAAAWLAGWFSERGWGSTTLRAVAGMLAALAVVYAGGWSWLAILSGPRAAFTMGIVPFVVADIVKISIAAAMLPYAQRLTARLS
jgi:biotin transport system substrate-specific component